MIKYEDFESILEKAGGQKIDVDVTGSSRRWKLHSLGTKIIFEWYPHLCNTYIDQIEIHGYNNMTMDEGCWPNKYKNNLLLLKDKDIVAVIPIEAVCLD